MAHGLAARTKVVIEVAEGAAKDVAAGDHLVLGTIGA